MTTELSPRQLAHAIGVSESSIRRWADRGLLEITKTLGGHRRIARHEALRFIRTTGADLKRPELLAVPEPKHRRGRAKAFAEQNQAVVDALFAGNEAVVKGLINSMYANGVSAAEICDGPLRYALSEIGKSWPGGSQEIFIEHRATNICTAALVELQSQLQPPHKNAPVAVGGAPSNDPYALPSQMVSVALQETGLRPVNLGANTPLDVLKASAREVDARVVWISFSTIPTRRVQEEFDSLARQLRRRKLELVVGGRQVAKLKVPGFVRVLSSLAELDDWARTKFA